MSGGETCDTDVLNTDTGPVNLRAEFEPETINLKWYNDGNQITVPTASNSCTYDTPISLPANPTKPGYKFKGWKVFTGIPIEYLQSTGTGLQYIDTGVSGDNNNYRFITDFMILDLPQGREYHTLWANYVDEEHNLWRILFTNSGILLIYTNTASRYPVFNDLHITLNQRYVIDFDYNNMTINNTPYVYNLQQKFVQSNNTTIKLLPHIGNTTYMRARIYSFKIYDNGTLIRDMIPVKDLSGVACMYDKVSGQFFYNAGTGDFIAGPEI